MLARSLSQQLIHGGVMIFDINDATGGPVVISDFDATTADDTYFLSAHRQILRWRMKHVVEMVNDGAAATQNGMSLMRKLYHSWIFCCACFD